VPRYRSKQPLPPWATATLDGREGRFIQIGNTLLLSKTFLALNGNAQLLYIRMVNEAGGKREFAFTAGDARKYEMSKSGFAKSLDELKEKNFIECAENNANLRKANVYRFCDGWKSVGRG